VGSFGLAGKRNGVVSNRSEEQRAKSEEQGTKLIANCQLQRRVVSTAEELVQSGVLTPQARTAHQPTHDSKAQKSPIRIKIAATRRDSDTRHAPASKKATAMPPRAARPLLSMFCLIVEGSQHDVVKENQ